MTSDQAQRIWVRVSFACLLVCGMLIGCRQQEAINPQYGYHTINGYVMGTTWSVEYEGAIDAQSRKELRKQLNDRLAELENQMSTWRADTEISKFNANGSTNWINVSPEVIEVVEEAQRVSRRTDGAFDITAYRLIRLWGFAGGEPPDELPGEKTIASGLAATGYTLLETRSEPPGLRKFVPGLQIDLSALAKGYAVDELAKLMKDQACTNFLVEIGGELLGNGLREKGGPWRVGIEDPIVGESHIGDVVELGSGAMASSGDYRNHIDIEGRLYAHIVDPRSGYPLLQRDIAVSVLAENCMAADAWATALTVIGRTNGIAFANTNGLAVMFRYRERNRIAVVQSTHWPE